MPVKKGKNKIGIKPNISQNLVLVFRIQGISSRNKNMLLRVGCLSSNGILAVIMTCNLANYLPGDSPGRPKIKPNKIRGICK